MRGNPFCVTGASPWLESSRIPQILDGMLKEAEWIPQIYERLPWLRQMDVIIFCLERAEGGIASGLSSSQEAIFTAFFAMVTQPIAEMVQALYTPPVLRSMMT